MVGTSERYGSAAEHVERFTMVDAKGRILLVIHFFFFQNSIKLMSGDLNFEYKVKIVLQKIEKRPQHTY